MVVVIGACTLAYAASMAVRIWLYMTSLGGPELVKFSDNEARAARDDVLTNLHGDGASLSASPR